MERSVVTRLETVAFEPGRNSKAWTARSANKLESSHSRLQNTSSADAGFQVREQAKRTNVSSTGDWCLTAWFSPRARRAEHTAKASGTDAFQITRDLSRLITKTPMRHFQPISKVGGTDWIYILPTTRKIHLVRSNFEHETTDLFIEPDSPG